MNIFRLFQKKKSNDVDLDSINSESIQQSSWQSDVPSKKITYTWTNINAHTTELQNNSIFSRIKRRRSIHKRKNLLKNVSGIAHPGELLVFLGASGAGKTTLFNCLAVQNTKYLTVNGSILINGNHANLATIRKHLAYVQQDDMFIGYLTVKEHLLFQALVKMDSKVPYKEKLKRTEIVISELLLTNCQNTTIGVQGVIKGISGGERKRLAVGSELLTNPSFLLIDEPTSGLDSSMSLNIIKILKSVTQIGRTVICTIHQPSSEMYCYFDKILLMADGRTAFLGRPDEAIEFFEKQVGPCPINVNPPEYFMRILAINPETPESSHEFINSICDAYESSEYFYHFSTTKPLKNVLWSSQIYRTHYKVSWFAQLRALVWRNWLAIMKNPRIVRVRLIQSVLVAAVNSIIYFQQPLTSPSVQNINGALFIFVSNMTFQNFFGVINTFCGEMKIFINEHKNGMYRTDVYFLSKVLTELPIYSITSLIFTSICYVSINLNPEWSRFIWCLIINLLTTYAVMSFGYLISAASGSLSVALTIGPPLLTPFLLFGGFLLNTNSVPYFLKWFAELSWFKYGNAALLINQWSNVTNIKCDIEEINCISDGHVVLEEYGFLENQFFGAVFSLLLLSLGYRVMAFLVLLLRSYIFCR